MKSLKKILSIFAAFMMVVGLTMTNASAATASITIDNATPGKEYSIYKLFSVDENTQSVYTANQSERDRFYSNGQLLSGSPFEFEENKTLSTEGNTIYNVTPANNPTTGKAYTAEEIVAFFDTNKNILGRATKSIEADSTTVKFDNLDHGYYYISSNTGAVVSLYNAGNITIKDKNDINFDKKSNNETTVDHQVGDIVPFTITMTAYEGWENVIISDEMTKGLAYVANDKSPVDVKVTVNGDELVNDVASGTTKYTLTEKKQEELSSNYTSGFNLKFDNSVFKTPNIKKYEIVITYKATVTADAVFEEVSKNNAKLVKDNDPQINGKEVKVYNWDLTINKVDGENNTGLQGAKFNIYRTVTHEDGTTSEELVKFTTKTETEDGVSKTVYVADKNGSGDLVTPKGGKLEIRGLDNVKYVIKEIEAPNGYNLLTEPVEFTPGTEVDGNVVIEKEIQNNKGVQLPSTGGMGTTMIYIAGAILMVGAAIIFVTNKRMKHE